ncbi:hypothetical protein PCCS19_28650 [Paenibacillus sp. CCS19]|uniref:hypothetical protein n=1 Tax=Paenibacillus sp. CCS19 TaxID=3158387 RepID=UPI00256137A3|nr:hypothetical protein [Paenibacillus cellulosilyticus]GMK39810.1 hypothetical protein PCCS19_28650 [Paenibacillus cellulosilyticus]
MEEWKRDPIRSSVEQSIENPQTAYETERQLGAGISTRKAAPEKTDGEASN